MDIKVPLTLGAVPRLTRSDPQLAALLKSKHPVVIEGSGLVRVFDDELTTKVSQLVDKWDLEYLQASVPSKHNFSDLIHLIRKFKVACQRISGPSLLVFWSRKEQVPAPFPHECWSEKYGVQWIFNLLQRQRKGRQVWMKEMCITFRESGIIFKQSWKSKWVLHWSKISKNLISVGCENVPR